MKKLEQLQSKSGKTPQGKSKQKICEKPKPSNPSGILTEKEKAFCLEYCTDWNATRAAKAAGYSEKSAREIASRLLTKVNILDHVKKIQATIEESIGLSKMRVLRELMKIAFSDTSKIHKTWVEKNKFESLPADVKSCIQEVETRIVKKNNSTKNDPEMIDVEMVRVKLYNKQSGLEAISKIMGYDAPVKVTGELRIDSVEFKITRK